MTSKKDLLRPNRESAKLMYMTKRDDRFNVALRPAERRALVALADLHGVSMADEVRRLVNREARLEGVAPATEARDRNP